MMLFTFNNCYAGIYTYLNVTLYLDCLFYGITFSVVCRRQELKMNSLALFIMLVVNSYTESDKKTVVLF